MSLMEPRCMVCGAPLDKGAPFEKTVRKSEVCSDRCYRIYMDMPEEETEEPTGNDQVFLAWEQFDQFCRQYAKDHPDEEPDLEEMIRLYCGYDRAERRPE